MASIYILADLAFFFLDSMDGKSKLSLQIQLHTGSRNTGGGGWEPFRTGKGVGWGTQTYDSTETLVLYIHNTILILILVCM